MEGPASTENAPTSNVLPAATAMADGTTANKKKAPKSKGCYAMSHSFLTKAKTFGTNYPNSNMVIMLGTSYQKDKWHVAELRHVTNDEAWLQALKSFIQQAFAEKERNPNAIFSSPDSNFDQGDHEKALQLAVSQGEFSRLQYRRYCAILEKVKKGREKEAAARLKNTQRRQTSGPTGAISSRIDGNVGQLGISSVDIDGEESEEDESEDEGEEKECATSPVRLAPTRAAQLDSQPVELDAPNALQAPAATIRLIQQQDRQETLPGPSVVAAAAAAAITATGAIAQAAFPPPAEAMAAAGQLPETANMPLPNPAITSTDVSGSGTGIHTTEMLQTLATEEPVAATAGPSSAPTISTYGRKHTKNTRFFNENFADPLEEGDEQQQAAKKQRVASRAETTLSVEEKNKLKVIIHEKHKEFWDPINSKKAKGYQAAALNEMHCLYNEGTADHARVVAVLSEPQKIANFIFNNMPGGTKEFPHVKEFEASQFQHAEAIAAKQVEENGLGIGAPLAGATIQEVNNWILLILN